MNRDVEPTRQSIRKRPAMYIGDRDIDKFSVFVGAAMLVEDLNGVPLENRIFPIDWHEFEKYVAKRTGYHSNGKSFAVAKILGVDDPLGKWFEFYDDYLKEQQCKNV